MKLVNRIFKFEGNRALSFILIFSASCFYLTGTVPAQGQSASRSRTVRQPPAAEATVTLNEEFVNEFLEAMFTKLGEPEFPLSVMRNEAENNPSEVETAHASSNTSGQCASVIVLERERNGVKTAVRFESGQIIAPLAFSGTYNTGLLGCLSFTGVANSVVTLEFDRGRQAIMARVRVDDVELNGLPRLASGVLVNLLQNSIDRKLNPYELFKAEQLSATVPIKAAGGSLRLRPREMRPEVIPGAVRIQIIYEFIAINETTR